MAKRKKSKKDAKLLQRVPGTAKIATKEVSRKQQVRQLYREKGEDAARKLGAKLGLPSKTLDFYIKETIRIDGGLIPARRTVGATTEASPRTSNGPHYRFQSLAAAEAALAGIIARSNGGLNPKAFKIETKEGANPMTQGPMRAIVPDKDYIKKHGCFTKKGLSNLRKEGFEVAGGMIKQVRKRGPRGRNAA